jgi:hypothetical protein
MITIPEAIRSVLKRGEFRDLLPEDINMGLCHRFARAVQKATDADARIVGDPRVTDAIDVEVISEETRGCGHVWLYDGSRHYDAEAPDGVRRWSDLPCV